MSTNTASEDPGKKSIVLRATITALVSVCGMCGHGNQYRFDDEPLTARYEHLTSETTHKNGERESTDLSVLPLVACFNCGSQQEVRVRFREQE